MVGSEAVAGGLLRSPRRQIREFGALGLLSCAVGCGGHRRASASKASGEPRASFDGPVQAGAPAVRGARFDIDPPSPPPRLWRPGDLIRGGSRSGPPVVAITSDDGPTGVDAIRMADHMRDAGLEGRITYFMIANNLAVFPEAGRQLRDRGYGIANHSLTHASYNAERIAAEIEPAQDVFAGVLGVRPEYFRSPGLTRGASIQQVLARNAMVNVFTSDDLRDWVSPRISSSQLVANVERTLHPGYILLIHDGGNHQPTINAMPMIIETIRRRGYEIVTLDEVLSIAPLEVESRIFLDMREEVAADIVAAGVVGDEHIDIVAEYRTYLELNTNLSPERRELIEAKIAEAIQARSDPRSP